MFSVTNWNKFTSLYKRSNHEDLKLLNGLQRNEKDPTQRKLTYFGKFMGLCLSETYYFSSQTPIKKDLLNKQCKINWENKWNEGRI